MKLKILVWIRFMASVYSNDYNTIAQHAKDLDITHNHASKVARQLQIRQYVTKNYNNGRNCKLKLTDKGKQLAEKCVWVVDLHNE